MCGVAGYVNLDGRPASPVILKEMCDSIAHRGPDGEGRVIIENVALGHRRLSIIDLSSLAQQPMATEDCDHVITYNGETYNFKELKLELEARGHGFRSQSDSEVVLAAFAEWGTDALDRLNGMFAFAILSKSERRLTLARDRYGVKPLYYARCGDVLMFASEIKAFLAHPAFRAELDPNGLAEYMTFQNYMTSRTLFRNARILPAGSYMSVGMDGVVGEPRRYWDFRFRSDRPAKNYAAYLDELDHLFVQAVNRQLVSDVPVSAYLSGGMDTGSITAVASRQLPGMRSFTVGFDMGSVSGMEIAFDEREKAERLSAIHGTEHYQMVLKSGDMERSVERLVWHLEEPRVGQSYPNFYAAKLAGNFGKVVLSGSGGDELFAGYPWRYYRTMESSSFDDFARRYFDFWQRLLPSGAVKDTLAPVWDSVDVDPFEVFRGVFEEHENSLETTEDYVNHSLYFEAKTFLHGLLVMEDKLSMAHSLEARIPFLDNDLVDFAMQLPLIHKLAASGDVERVDENRPGRKTAVYSRDGKKILRDAMSRYIPEEVAQAAKQGFSGPDATWFRGQSIDYVRRVVLNPKAKLYDYVDHAAVDRLVADHLEGRENRRLLIWSLISLVSWCEQFLVEAPRHALLEA